MKTSIFENLKPEKKSQLPPNSFFSYCRDTDNFFTILVFEMLGIFDRRLVNRYLDYTSTTLKLFHMHLLGN